MDAYLVSPDMAKVLHLVRPEKHLVGSEMDQVHLHLVIPDMEKAHHLLIEIDKRLFPLILAVTEDSKRH